MDSMVEIYLNRANNEILLAQTVKRLSENQEDKENFKLPSDITFYSSVISHSYYSIFYSAKAILLTKDIKTSSPEVHKKNFDKFKETFVDTGILDVNLLTIYKKMIVKADQLLQIFKDEKWKRGHFTYETIPQANKDPADESLDHARTFFNNIKKVIKTK
ncbi:MAG: HEPN domain-containing protein [Nanoarchaeota archaeon]|nr:HEPN domain-containing protein [Nanoarchaeota archaeon]